MSSVSQPQIPTTDNSTQVMHFLKYIEKDANNSHELASMGVHTKLAKTIADFLANPLNGMVNTFLSARKNLVNLLDGIIVKNFLIVNKKIILKAYHAKQDYALSYYIILNEDTTENREVFFDFLDSYQSLDIERQVPIYFSFLPKEGITCDGLENELTLE